ncbi:hypothetical protein EDC94DRAFT_622008 [Helicostylum pulchrum]|uniref:Uncharacterized protein n=1 Tax=Helicostylum pulchrum TaxID=562976 RepID=A0ABP9XPB3_9FUNG|nr:hypothetical protein EDC94DRAFT_622008 [Helicostylum pulchrum]
MQTKFTILLLSACIFLFAQVQAACSCDANDTACLQNCVIQGQGCITACNGDNACYDNCIANFWPGQSVASASAPVVSASSDASVAPTSVVTPPSASSPAVASTSVPTGPSSPASPVVSSSRPVVSNSATFSPTAPTTAEPPQPTENSASSSFLVPAVAIGVASVTVITQVFFLARMGSVLFN